MATPDLDAYFARIGYAGPRAPALPVLHAITAHHTAAIPFENLDVLLGRPISLDLPAVEQKLIRSRRGGYCFEQNGLLLQVLAALGFAVRPLSARVRWQRPRDYTPARTHLFIHVEFDGESWITDVGIGGMSLTSALRLDLSGAEQATPHEPRRLIREDGRCFHQVKLGEHWQDLCEFTLEEMPPIDRELANWYTSAHPQSTFRGRLQAARAVPGGGRKSLLNREYTVRRNGEVLEKREIASPDELLALLAAEFGLHFPAGTRFGPPGSPWPS